MDGWWANRAGADAWWWGRGVWRGHGLRGDRVENLGGATESGDGVLRARGPAKRIRTGERGRLVRSRLGAIDRWRAPDSGLREPQMRRRTLLFCSRFSISSNNLLSRMRTNVGSSRAEVVHGRISEVGLKLLASAAGSVAGVGAGDGAGRREIRGAGCELSDGRGVSLEDR